MTNIQAQVQYSVLIDGYILALQRGRTDLQEKIISALNSKNGANISLSLVRARLQYESNDYRAAAETIVRVAKQPWGKDTVINAMAIFLRDLPIDDKFFSFMGEAIRQEIGTDILYTYLVSSLMKQDRKGDASQVHRFFDDHQACPKQMTFVNEIWKNRSKESGDEYRAKNIGWLGELFEDCLDLCRPYLTEETVAYDFGCGSGLFGEAMRPYVKYQIGTDLSEKFASLATTGIYDEIVIADGLELKNMGLRRGHLIYSSAVFQYFNNLEPIFSSLRELLLEGGLMVFDTVCKRDDDSMPYSLMSLQAYAHAPEFVSQCAEEAGFKVLASKDGRYSEHYESSIFLLQRVH